MFFLSRGAAGGKNELGRLLNDFSPRRSFIDSEETYMVYAASALETFNNDVILKGKIVLDFEKYVCEFLKYLFASPRTFFSYYSIFASFLTPISATGLAIDFDILNHDDDSLKNQFYSNKQLRAYIQDFHNKLPKNHPDSNSFHE